MSITTPANGLMVFDITTNTFWFYKNTLWTEITNGITLPYAGSGNTSSITFSITNPNASGAALSGQSSGSGPGIIGISKSGPGGLFSSTTGPAIKIINGGAEINGIVTIADGTQGQNKVLTSDANGVASWHNPPTPAISSKVLSIPGTAFMVSDGPFASFSRVNTAGAVLVGMTIGTLTPNLASLYAPVTLPYSAIVTNLKVIYGNGTTNNCNLSLVRNTYANNSIDSTSIANLVLPGQVINDIVPLNSPILNHTVSNTTVSYYLYVTSSANQKQ